MKQKQVLALCSPVIAAFTLSACFTGEADLKQKKQEQIDKSQKDSIDGKGRVFYDKESGIGIIFRVAPSAETVEKRGLDIRPVFVDVRRQKYMYDPTTNMLCFLGYQSHHCFNPNKSDHQYEVPDDLKNSIKLIEEAALRP